MGGDDCSTTVDQDVKEIIDDLNTAEAEVQAFADSMASSVALRNPKMSKSSTDRENINLDDPKSIQEKIQEKEKEIMNMIDIYNSYSNDTKIEKLGLSKSKIAAELSTSIKNLDSANTTAVVNATVIMPSGLNKFMFESAPAMDYLYTEEANATNTSTNTCLNDCSSNGLCYNDTCYCRQGFLGADCSVLQSTVNSKGIKIEEAVKIAGGVLFVGFITGKEPTQPSNY